MTTPSSRLRRRLASSCAAGLVLTIGCGDEPTAPSASGHSQAFISASHDELTFRQVSAGIEHTCGVTRDNRAYCWGRNSDGQLGNGTVGEGPEVSVPGEPGLTCSTRPVAVVGGLRFLQVSAGLLHTCGITTDNRLYCWGDNSRGQAGNGYADAIGTPTRMVTDLRFRQISAGLSHTCGITLTDLAYCWGSFLSGELGDGRTGGFEFTPVAVSGGRRWRQLSAGRGHTCGVTTTDRAYCWGLNNDGAVGDGSTTNRSTPVAVASGMRFLRIDAGFSHTCAINIGHRAFCWGANTFGQLGDGTRTQRLTPTAVAGTRVFEQLSAGREFTCAVTLDRARDS